MNQVDPYIVSSRRKRISAFMIDHCVITFFLVSVIFLMLGPDFLDDSSGMSPIMVIVMLPGFILYISKDLIKGISPGKWIMGITVRDSTNPKETPSLAKLFARNLFLVIWPVELIALGTSLEKRRLGDKVLKTIVVENDRKPAKSLRIIVIGVVLLMAFAFIFLFTTSAMKASDAYKTAIHEIVNNKEILNETGGIKGYGLFPTGNISISNGSGQAHLEIKVIGNVKNLNVNVDLTKEPDGKWILSRLEK